MNLLKIVIISPALRKSCPIIPNYERLYRLTIEVWDHKQEPLNFPWQINGLIVSLVNLAHAFSLWSTFWLFCRVEWLQRKGTELAASLDSVWAPAPDFLILSREGKAEIWAKEGMFLNVLFSLFEYIFFLYSNLVL